MSRIADLISHHCPDGVEYREVSNVMEKVRSNGKLPRSKYEESGLIEVIDQGQELIAAYSSNLSMANPPAKWILFGDHTRTVKWWEGSFVQGADGLVPLQVKVPGNPKFYYYAMKNLDITNRGYNRHWSVVKDMKLPVPPLEVQDEIVRILDSYTQLEQDLESELEAELEVRRKQYEYYRDSLLSLENLTNHLGKDNVKLLPLKDVSSYSIEKISASLTDKNSYVGVDSLIANKRGKKPSEYAPKTNKLSKFHPDDILIGNIRPYLRKIWHSDLTGGASGDVLVITIKDEKRKEIISKFLYHALASENFFEYDSRFAKGAKMPRGDKKAIMDYKFPLPPLSEQERIVAILDKFDALVNDLSSGLPAEIEARRKQYEYYRDRLLIFTPSN